MSVIEVEHLRKRYRDVVAVDDVSFTVERGEIFGILGPNGAGKTTTVEIIEGLRTPDDGTVRVLGLDPRRDGAELRQRVGVQLQESQLPEGGVEAIRRLRETAPSVRVLVLTTYDTDSDVLPAIEAGATGYLLKDAPREELIRAVRAAFKGESVLSPAVARRLMGQVRKPPPEALSQRELKVLQLIADGATNREAAAKLFVSEATIKTHLLHIYDKLGVRDRAAAVGEAYRRRLFT